MRIRSRSIQNFFATILLIGGLVLAGYYLSNNETIFSGFQLYKAGKINKIITSHYNSAIEGTILDQFFDFPAQVIPVKESKILHKKKPLSENVIITQNLNLDLQTSGFQSHTGNSTSQFYREHFSFPEKNFLLKNSLAQNEEDINYSATHFEIFNTKKSNRFEGLVKDFKQDKTETKKTHQARTHLLTGIKNWENTDQKSLAKFNSKLDIKNPFDTGIKKTTPSKILVKRGNENSKIRLDIVRNFSDDPLKTIINNVLIPTGLPKTAANVDAVARGMGLPSGALGDKGSLATSLGVSIEQLSNPETKLPVEIVKSINSNVDYIGEELDINNTTLSDYYNNALKNNFFTDMTQNF